MMQLQRAAMPKLKWKREKDDALGRSDANRKLTAPWACWATPKKANKAVPMLAAPMVHVFLEKEEDSLWEAMLEKIGQAITMAPMDLVATSSLDTPFARLAAWVMMGGESASS
ncbi:unnamed protein product [Ilex paraguariensis]|uniref:Uncharacterized protein n=1 Tax=Ilex paraguariensis TaxID=185542 RepID=A0ABC8TJU3_9AQUA